MLQHPHIVPLLSAGEAEGLPYYMMPYVAGESLRGRLARGGELTVSEAVRVLVEVTRGVSHAHRHSVVHRDLSPRNVLLAEDGRRWWPTSAWRRRCRRRPVRRPLLAPSGSR